MNYDDFYDFDREPNEFEEQIEELKASLAKTIKEEFQEEMRRLKKENEELREFRNAKKEYDRILREKTEEVKTIAEKTKRDVLNTTLKNFFGENLNVAYRVRENWIEFKKCERCNDSRYIEYKTPFGGEAKERCVCNQHIYQYEPQECELFSFKATSSESVKKAIPQLNYISNGFVYESCKLYRGEDFGKINRKTMIFSEREKCEEYCKWLNEKELKKSEEYMNEWGLSL